MVFYRNNFRTRSKKSDFDKDPVLDRLETQIKKSGIETEFTKNIDLSWALENISRLVKQYANNEYILLFPFCSPKLKNKKVALLQRTNTTTKTRTKK